MSGAAVVMAIVLSAFFLVGVTVGIIAVIAVSASRTGTAARRARLLQESIDKISAVT